MNLMEYLGVLCFLVGAAAMVGAHWPLPLPDEQPPARLPPIPPTLQQAVAKYGAPNLRLLLKDGENTRFTRVLSVEYGSIYTTPILESVQHDILVCERIPIAEFRLRVAQGTAVLYYATDDGFYVARRGDE
jgi:hypothetical protein